MNKSTPSSKENRVLQDFGVKVDVPLTKLTLCFDVVNVNMIRRPLSLGVCPEIYDKKVDSPSDPYLLRPDTSSIRYSRGESDDHETRQGES